MSKRISAFFQHWPPYSGAAALRGWSILRGLAELSSDDEVALRVYTTTPNPGSLDGVDVTVLPVAELENSEKLSRRVLGELRMGWVAAREILKRNSGCDFLVVSMPAYLTCMVLSCMARWYKVPYALELRDVYPQVYAEAGLIGRGSLIYRFFARISRRAYESAACVVTATRGLERVVRGESQSAHVHCVYNGFPGTFLSRNAAKYDRFTVCFHGVMGFFQDIETLISVATELQRHDVDVLVVGYGRQETLLRGNLPPNLTFRGRLPFDQTVAEIEKSHLGLCLRKDDGISKDAFPVKVWEYLGLGIPSVITPHCEAGEFIEANGCGYQLESGRVRAIVDTILKLKNNPHEFARLVDNCRRIRPAYTRENLGQEAASILLDYASQSRSA